MRTFDLHDRYLAARTLATRERLCLLDDIWTDRLKEPKISESEIKVLDALTAEMSSLLDELKECLEALLAPIGKLQIEWDEQFAALLQTSNVSDEIRSRVLSRVQQEGGIRALTLSSIDEVIRKVPDEQEELRRKMDIIHRKRHAEGDLTARCIIDAAGIGIGLALGGLGGFVLAGAAFALSVRNGCWG